MMMDVPLTAWLLFANAETVWADTEIVTQRSRTERHRYRFGDFARRTRALISVLDDLAPPEAIVATLAWNSAEHLEAYFAIPLSGRTLHTLNARLADDDLAWIIDDAGDDLIIASADLVPRLAAIADRLARLPRIIAIGAPEAAAAQRLGGVLDYEELVGQADPFEGVRTIDEHSRFGICYTSGTTGRPKGVASTHRSTVLHTALAVNAGNGPALSRGDCVLPVVPMFHVYAWGLPFGAVAAGSKLVFPTPNLDPSLLIDLIREEAVTKAGGVPTIWIAVAEELERRGGDLGQLRELLCGGSTPPPSLIATYRDRYGVGMLQAWGMTETSPIATTSRLPHALAHADPGTQLDWVASAGTPVAGIEVDVVGPDGTSVPHDAATMGDVYVRGPWVLDGYLHGAGAEAFVVRPGWFRTGDVGTIAPDGRLAIVDRTKDLIKSGGEWISSVKLETTLMGHPKVVEAAVVAVPHPVWGERPVAAVVLTEGATLDLEEARSWLAEAGIPRWQLPDALVQLDAIPRTSVGKFDKKVLRAQLESRASTLSTDSAAHRPASGAEQRSEALRSPQS
jgi:fatty-acyl-CoA synthase